MMDHHLFDVQKSKNEARVWVLPMPYSATTSYRSVTHLGPEAILQASSQVDFCDADVGTPEKAGIYMELNSDEVVHRNALARKAVQRIRKARQEGKPERGDDIELVNQCTHENDEFVSTWVENACAQNRLPIVLGGDHSVSFGAIKACVSLSNAEIGVLQVDAHADLRQEYESFVGSHASIIHRVKSELLVKHITQVGIRDFCEEELLEIQNSKGRLVTYFDRFLRSYRLEENFIELAKSIVSTLPENVYLTVDIDGLDPIFCPNTGTPVPGGLTFEQLIVLMDQLVQSGRRLVGLDLCEVAPPKSWPKEQLGEVWDANVGARLLYKMIGFALMSRGSRFVSLPNLPTPPGIS